VVAYPSSDRIIELWVGEVPTDEKGIKKIITEASSVHQGVVYSLDTILLKVDSVHGRRKNLLELTFGGISLIFITNE
jgi:hypothetical protein